MHNLYKHISYIYAHITAHIGTKHIQFLTLHWEQSLVLESPRTEDHFGSLRRQTQHSKFQMSRDSHFILLSLLSSQRSDAPLVCIGVNEEVPGKKVSSLVQMFLRAPVVGFSSQSSRILPSPPAQTPLLPLQLALAGPSLPVSRLLPPPRDLTHPLSHLGSYLIGETPKMPYFSMEIKLFSTMCWGGGEPGFLGEINQSWPKYAKVGSEEGECPLDADRGEASYYCLPCSALLVNFC